MTRLLWSAAVVALGAAPAIAQPGPEPQPAPVPEAPGLIIELDPDAVLAQIAAAAPGLERMAAGTIRRGRRAISIGPTLGLYGAGMPSPGEVDVAVTFGLGVELFKVPVLPTLHNLKALVMERAKAKLKQALKDELRGRPPAPGETEQMARQIWTEAVTEYLGLDNVRPRTMERPRLTLAVEGNRLLSSRTWVTRFRAGVGVWKVTVAGSIAAGFTDPETSVFAGAELVAHFLVSRRPRASVVDVFVRGDFELRHRDAANVDTVVLGVRYLLDVL